MSGKKITTSRANISNESKIPFEKSNQKEVLNFENELFENEIDKKSKRLEKSMDFEYIYEEIEPTFDEEYIFESNDIEKNEKIQKSKNYQETGDFISGQSSITSYMKDISKYKVVSREEELQMFKALKEGDESMVEEIFKANAKLVPFVVKRFAGVIASNPAMDFEDLISAGNMGLLKAIGLFDPSKGYKFTTYAYNWIYAFAERTICNDANLIRVPVHLQDKARKIKKVEKEMESQINRELTYEEKVKLIEDTLGNSRDVFQMEQYALYTSPISLNAIVNDEDDSTEFGDFIASTNHMPEEEAFGNALRQEILEIMELCLPERNIQVLKMRFGFDSGVCMTLEEVGKIFGVTRERIRQIESNSLRLLRRNRKFRHLKDYMGISEYPRS